MMKNFILTCLLLLGLSASSSAQEKVTVTGTVTDMNNEPLIGVSVSVRNVAGLGTTTDLDGKYSIKMEPYNTLIFSYLGYDKVEVLVKEQRLISIKMKEADAQVINEVVVTATGTQRKIAVTGAITTVEIEELKANPTASIANSLAGVVPGIMAMQTSGQPGSVAEFWIRSISTFGANNSALVLVDGFERDLNEVNVEDVESFTVLKDASTTAIYGSKGANGVILVNTRRGKEGKINISVKAEGFYNMLTQLPKFADGYTYASLANEAKITRNQPALFQPEELEIYRLKLDPDLYPNVNWMDEMLKDGAWSDRFSVNMSGGGTTARYYVSAGYQDQEGMYKVDKAMKDYDTSANYKKITYRTNVDIDITKTTLLKVGVAGTLQKENQPGVGHTAIWTALMGYNPILVPKMYSNGYVPAVNDNDTNADNNIDRFNPWVQATQTGFKEAWKNNIQTNVTVEQNFDFITKGLSFIGKLGYDTNNENAIQRLKYPALYQAERVRDENGEIIYKRFVPEMKMEQFTSNSGDRREYFEAEVHYGRRFSKHHVGGVLRYNQASKIQTQNIGSDLRNGIARRNQGLAGRVNYNWSSRYFVDFNFGYTGSENFSAGNRFGFFPAVSGAWNIAEESFIVNNLPWMNMFKVRYSWGKTGMDVIKFNNVEVRFPYLATLERMTEALDSYGFLQATSGGYQFADYNFARYYGGIRYSDFASPYITWETSIKQDLGIDYSMFRDKLSGAIDYFTELREGIYMERKYLPFMAGLENSDTGVKFPKANVGSVKVRGFDGNVAYKEKLGNVDLTLRGNITYSKNEILERDEENTIYTYKLMEGHRVDQAMGLIALGLFKDYEEIRNSPTQTFGDVMPGDIKYKDINGDGVIDDNDRAAIGATTKPNLTYGFGASARWKGFNVSVHFQGVGKSTYFINGSTVYMFSTGDGWGNILDDMAHSNRWILGVNEDPNADYPRLTYGNNVNNNRASTFWLRDGSYLRLKTVDVGYSLPKTWVNKAYLNDVRIFFIGTNLLTFAKFKGWDPEMGSSDGKKYPLSKTYSLGISVNL